MGGPTSRRRDAPYPATGGPETRPPGTRPVGQRSPERDTRRSPTPASAPVWTAGPTCGTCTSAPARPRHSAWRTTQTAHEQPHASAHGRVRSTRARTLRRLRRTCRCADGGDSPTLTAASFRRARRWSVDNSSRAITAFNWDLLGPPPRARLRGCALSAGGSDTRLPPATARPEGAGPRTRFSLIFTTTREAINRGGCGGCHRPPKRVTSRSWRLKRERRSGPHRHGRLRHWGNRLL